MLTKLETIREDETYDIIVLGAGAAGLAAALYAALRRQRVLLVEHTEYLGGTTALSAGTTWVPNTHHAATSAPDDSPEKALAFLDAVVGNNAPREHRKAFVRSGPSAIAALDEASDVKFRAYKLHPDYEQQAEGASLRGRALEPMPFDGRLLGAALKAIRPPIPEFTVFGGMMVDRNDINQLLGMGKSLASFRHATKILFHYGMDRLGGSRRGTRLLMGNALVGRFLKSLLDRKVPILLHTSAIEFLRNADGVAAVVLQEGTTRRQVRASKGIVLSGGGFNRHATRRQDWLKSPILDYSPSAPGHTGNLQDLAQSVGAVFDESGQDTAFWAPVSVRKRPDGSTAVFPHFVLDRSKPGTVCVNRRGQRFVNESSSYHLFARAMMSPENRDDAVPCFLITDAEGLRKYGLGMVRMTDRNLSPFIADGYLTEAGSIAELAGKLGVDGNNLAATIERMNDHAARGADPDFGRGTTPYHCVNGDAAHKPNPTLGPIATAPFYAVRLYPGDIGASRGLKVDDCGQVLGKDGQAIGHLYACGNEAQSIMGGTYPAPGITIGPAIVSAYRAIAHACGDNSIHGN